MLRRNVRTELAIHDRATAHTLFKTVRNPVLDSVLGITEKIMAFGVALWAE